MHEVIISVHGIDKIIKKTVLLLKNITLRIKEFYISENPLGSQGETDLLLTIWRQ